MAYYSLRILAAVFVAVSLSDHAVAQDCATKLTPCLPYLNATTGTTPPATCCTPLKSAVADQKACLCSLFKTPGLLESFGVNSTQVVDLAESCGVNADPTTLCSSTAAGAPSPSGVPTTTSGAAAPPPPGNDAAPGRIINVGVLSLILVLVSLMMQY